MLALAAGLAANRAPKLLAKSTLSSLIATAIAGIYWVVTIPDLPGMSLGQGFYTFVAAIVLGAVTAIRVLRQRAI
ncbi:MAG TPA: hypothetical protein VGC41_18410 [Kofleriaceae bacterium]